MGDGLLIYFGWPHAHEDDAERAISAGLGILKAVRSMTAVKGRPLAVRIGIATGRVVVGDIVGEGASQAAAIVGEAPNLAARLQAIAEPNTIVIADATYALAGGLFECTSLGARALKGFDTPLTVWRVDALRSIESRFEATRMRSLTPFVGRDEEIAVLERRWQRACRGEGQVVLLSGEAGIGKSRIVSAFRERVGANHTPGCATSARPITPTPPYIPSSSNSRSPPASRATTILLASSPSLRSFLRFPAAPRQRRSR